MEPDPIEELLGLIEEDAVLQALLDASTIPATGLTHNFFARENERVGKTLYNFFRALEDPEFRARRAEAKKWDDIWWELMKERADDIPPPGPAGVSAAQSLNINPEELLSKADQGGRKRFGSFWGDILRGPDVGYGRTARRNFINTIRAVNPVALLVQLAVEEALIRGAQNETLMEGVRRGMEQSAESSTERVPTYRRSPTGA